MTLLLDVCQDWRCTACGLTKQTRGPFRPNLLHPCPKLHGITTPMLHPSVKAKVEAVVRPDYVGSEIVTYDDRRKPIMSIVTTRDNGQDVAIFAPQARATADVPQFGNSRQRVYRLADFLKRRAARI